MTLLFLQALLVMCQPLLHGILMISQKKPDLAKGQLTKLVGIIIQREQSTSIELEKRDSISRSRSIPASSKDINPYFLGKRKTINLNNAMQNKEIEEEHYALPQIDAKKKARAFCLCRYLGRSSTIPNWTGFNTRLTVNRNIPTQSKLGYLPVIDATELQCNSK